MSWMFSLVGWGSQLGAWLVKSPKNVRRSSQGSHEEGSWCSGGDLRARDVALFFNKRDYLIVFLSLCSSDSSHLDNTRAWDNELELVQMLDREMPVMILRSGWEIRLYLFRHWVKYGEHISYAGSRNWLATLQAELRIVRQKQSF